MRNRVGGQEVWRSHNLRTSLTQALGDEIWLLIFGFANAQRDIDTFIDQIDSAIDQQQIELDLWVPGEEITNQWI
ncbi:hypothetical protein RS3R2_42510 [Pseudomonas lactis]|nr:hypothetical protein RS3R2_42510 [Pseudomonas lactis]